MYEVTGGKLHHAKLAKQCLVRIMIKIEGALSEEFRKKASLSRQKPHKKFSLGRRRVQLKLDKLSNGYSPFSKTIKFGISLN